MHPKNPASMSPAVVLRLAIDLVHGGAAVRTAHELYRGPLADGVAAEWVLSVRESARRSYLDATARWTPSR